MAIPSPDSQPPSQAQTPLQPQPQIQTSSQTQRPILSVNIHRPPSVQAQPTLAPAMPTLQPKPAPQATSTQTKPQDDAEAPPHSPISPKGLAARLASMPPYNAPNVLKQPPNPVPIAESDNPDVIALRSALMILQVQRESARRDIKELQKLKEEAVQDPEAYVQELVRRSQQQQQQERPQADGVTTSRSGGAVKEDLLAPTMRYLVDGLGEKSDFLQPDTNATNEAKPKVEETSRKRTTPKQSKKPKREGSASTSHSESESSSEGEASKSKFATAPKAQNIYRMPPVNWAKYQLAGAGLEKLHHDEQIRPTAGKPADPPPPSNGSDVSSASERYVMAAPYEPVLDAVRMGHPSDHPMQTRRKGSKR